MADAITYTLDDGVGLITLDDGKVNAMALPFFDALNAALDRTERDKPPATIITGRAGMFSAGLNLKLLPTLPPDELRKTMLAFGRTMLRVFTFPIPTVAAVSGHAIAGGAMLAFACDLRFMADGPFRLHLNEVAIGLVLPTWAIMLAQSAIPPRRQTEAILHARAYSAAEAAERGIIEGAVPSHELLERARAATEPLRGLDLVAYAGSKRRHRAAAVEWAMARLETEVAALPAR